MALTDEKKGAVVRMLREKNLYQTGLEFNLDKLYKDSVAVKNAVSRIYKEVQKDPERYGINQDIVTQVEAAMQARSPLGTRQSQLSLREKEDAAENVDFKTLVLEGRKKAYQLLMKKIDHTFKNKKALDDANISSLAQTFGIIFDKAQIIQGEATENVALLAKIDGTLSPDDAISAVLKMREIYQVDKDRTKKK